MFEFIATKNDAGRTLIKLLQKYLNNLPNSKIEKIFRKKDVKVNGKRTNQKDLIINENDQVVIYGIFDASVASTTVNTKPNLIILYEDEHILVLNKQAGVEVHGSDNSLDNQVLSYLNYKQVDSFKPSHIGRLDKETSGIIVYGKTYLAVSRLNEHNHQFTKKYQFQSEFNGPEQTLKLYLYKDETNKKVKASKVEVPNSKLAITKLYIENKKKIAEILTGKKHQIRVSLQFIGKPIYGDRRYGGKKMDRLMLHSYYLKLSGLTGELKYLNNMEFYALAKW
ncbi:pseudouridine synthase [Mycoplasma corogypsi]|uniref:RluA family pseudouridine synthase n=1 Tax=Mycoplasma corogypsi TaxID=2106 RepID=UPI003873244D